MIQVARSKGKTGSTDMCSQSVQSAWRSTTLEPVAFLIIFSGTIVSAPEIETNLKLWKVCWARLNYSRDICDNLLDDDNVEYLKEAQKSLNEFSILLEWIQQIPLFFFSLLAGSLADDFGRKLLLIIPTIGHVAGAVCEIINFTFIETLPFNFYYYEAIHYYFGGPAVYYLAYYAYGSSVSSPDERAQRLTRYDAFEQIGVVAGSLLGPVIFNNLGYYTTFGTKLTIRILALFYLIFFIKEVVPVQERLKVSRHPGICFYAMKRYLFTPVKEMGQSLLKKREKNLRWILYSLIFAYSIYWFCFEETQKYFYATAKLDDFDGNDWAHLSVVRTSLSALSGLFLIPFLSGPLHFDDASILILIETTIVLSNIWLAFIQTKWEFWVTQCLLFMRYNQYGTARSLMTKCIHADEFGKVFSAIAFATAFMPFLGQPTYRILYNSTVDTFPGAIFLLSAALFFITVLIYILIHTFKDSLLFSQEGDAINSVEEILKEEEIITSVQDQRGSLLLSGMHDELHLNPVKLIAEMPISEEETAYKK